MGGRYDGFDFSRARFYLMAFIVIVVAGAVLKVTAPVLIPFTIAVLLAFVLEPVVVGLERLKIPRILGILAVMLLVGAIIFLFGFLLFSSGRTLMRVYPRYENRFSEIYAALAPLLNLPYDEHLTFFQNLWGQLGVREGVRGLALSLSSSFLSFSQNAIMVVLFIVFLMLESAHFSAKIGLAFENKLSSGIRRVARDIIIQVSRYLSVKFFVSLATGIFVTLGLWVIGVDFPVLWGAVSFVLNFIPNIGSIGAGVGVTVFALVQFWPSFVPVFLAAGIMLGVNMIIGNFLEPRIQGQNLGLSPFVIVVSLLLWGWLWGFAGLVLAVPMTVILKIVCENVPVLEPLAIIIGSYKETLERRGGADKDQVLDL